MNPKVVTLDVREDLRSGRAPFEKIMSVVAGLPAGEQLRLLAPFEPGPLIHVLAKQGFTHTVRTMPTGDCEVTLTRGSPVNLSPAAEARGHAVPAGTRRTSEECVVVDARGLEPPQPLVRILEALASLPEGAVLQAHTDRRPLHLYSQLEERGFRAETEEASDGSFITQIWR